MKRVVKGFTLFIASSIYVWLLFLTAISVALFFSMREPTTLKAWLKSSGVYANVVEEVSKLATFEQAKDGATVRITSEDVRLSAQQAYSPESLQADTENIVDGFYGWFRGDTSGPQFNVDFSGRQASFTNGLVARLEQKIAELPECETTGQFALQSFDPFRADCRPKDINLDAELDALRRDMATGKDFLPQLTFSGDDVKIYQGSEQAGVGTAMPWVPRAYKMLLYGPWLIMFLAIITALALIFLSSTKRKGARRVASGLLFTGAILILAGFLLRPAIEMLNDWSTKSLGSQGSLSQNIVDPFFQQVNNTYSRFNIFFGVGYAIPALVIYGVLILTRHKSEEDPPAESPSPVADSPPAPPVVSTDNQVPNKVDEPAPPQTPSSASSETPVGARPVTPPASRPSREVTRRPPMIQG